MHELPVVLDLIKLANGEAEKEHLAHIKSIRLVVGELSSVMDESVQMYFEMLAEGTPCQGARLVFDHRPAMLRCTVCGKKFPHERDFSCPECGGDGFLIKGTGMELYVESIEADS